MTTKQLLEMTQLITMKQLLNMTTIGLVSVMTIEQRMTPGDLHFSSRLSFFCEYLIILAQRGKNRSGD